MTKNVKILKQRLHDMLDKYFSAQLLLLSYDMDRGSSPYIDWAAEPIGFTGLSGAGSIGTAEAVAVVLGGEWYEIYQSDRIQASALAWAAGRGNERAVMMFLERVSVNPDQVDPKYGRTPLTWAAMGGHEMIVKMLLEREAVNPDRADPKYGRTPLAWAAMNGHEGVVKILWHCPNVHSAVPDNANQTPLSLALSEGHDRVARMLQEWEDVNSDKANHSGPASPPSPDNNLPITNNPRTIRSIFWTAIGRYWNWRR